jgi:hypothetical protein
MKAHDVADARAEQPVTAGGAATPAGEGRGYQSRPFLKIRRGYTDLLTATKRKNIIHGLVEMASRMPSGCCGSMRRPVRTCPSRPS